MQDYPAVYFRVYLAGAESDLRFLKYYTFIKKFEMDVYGIGSIDGIEYLPDDLSQFSFGLTKKRFSLSFLGKFKNLRELYLEGQSKNIEVISELKNIEKIQLRSITLKDLSILVPLKKLWWLAIKLGGTCNLSLLPELTGLKYLELWMIRGLKDISPISKLVNLQKLFLDRLKNVKSLPDFSLCRNLKDIQINTTKEGISDVSSLQSAVNLEELLFSGHTLQPGDFICLKKHPSLKCALIGLGSHKKNTEIEKILSLPQPDRFLVKNKVT